MKCYKKQRKKNHTNSTTNKIEKLKKSTTRRKKKNYSCTVLHDDRLNTTRSDARTQRHKCLPAYHSASQTNEKERVKKNKSKEIGI